MNTDTDNVRELLDHLEVEAREVAEAVDAVLDAVEAGEEDREAAAAKAHEYASILFADLERGLASAATARAAERAGAARERALADYYAGRAKAAEARVAVIDQLVERALLTAAEVRGTETLRIKGRRVNVGLVRNPPRVELEIPPELLPPAYQRWTCAADKAALKAALKDGQVIAGVELRRTLRVDWRGA